MANGVLASHSSGEAEYGRASVVYADNPIIPRLFLGDTSVRPETIVHHVNRYNLAASFVTGQTTVLDICCGTGYGTEIMRKAGASGAIGVDLSAEAIETAKIDYPECVFVVDAVQNFLRTNRPPELGVVTFFEAIEHLERPAGLSILDSVQTSILSDGSFFVSTPRDIRADVNKDHITQWGFDELVDELTSRFNEVDMFGQDWATGNFTREDPAGASFYVARCSQPIN